MGISGGWVAIDGLLLIAERCVPAPGDHLCGLAWDGQFLWHSDAGTDKIYRLSPETGAVVAALSCRQVRTCLAYDGAAGQVWQIAGRPKAIRVVDAATGELVETVRIVSEPEDACALFLEAGSYWLGWKTDGRIEQRRRADGSLLATYRAGGSVNGLVRIGETLWYTDYGASALVAFDMSTSAERRFRLEGQPTGLCWDGQRFWYSDYTHKQLCAVSLP